MAYRLNSGEAVAAGLERIAREEMKSAAALLASARGQARHTAIHEARKSIKKVRALLRLLGEDLGEVPRRDAVLLRDTAHSLAPLRDAAVALETFNVLYSTHRAALRSGVLLSIRRELAARLKVPMSRPGTGAALAAAAGALRQVAADVEAWKLEASTPAAVAEGFAAAYRRGRKAMRAALASREAADYHEWRKRVKDHWYHVRLFATVHPDVLRKHGRQLAKLEACLGDEHNLFLLREAVARRPEEFGSASAIRLFYALVQASRHELQVQAAQWGAKVYGEKAGVFADRVRTLWTAGPVLR